MKKHIKIMKYIFILYITSTHSCDIVTDFDSQVIQLVGEAY